MAAEQPRTGENPSENALDPHAALRMQILSTEHWSLLATRSLTYSESFSRVAMFISVLSGAMIAIALVAQADRFGRTFVMITILILITVLVVGLATIGRVRRINNDDLQWVIGMNRIRNAYLELHPELEKYFISSHYDDWPGITATLNMQDVPSRGLGALLHGVQTLPGTLGTVVAIVSAALAGLIALELGASTAVCVVVAVLAFFLAFGLLGYWGVKSINAYWKTLSPKFAHPPR
jgi:hypothetical protein